MQTTHKLDRFPDKPTQSSRHVLPTLVDGEWLAQLKKDGWRALLFQDSGIWTPISRHAEELPISPAVLASLDAIDVPDGTILDGEWMGRRAGVAERLWLFDLIRAGGEWLTKTAASQRFKLLQKIAPAAMIVEHTYEGYPAFYERHQADPANEGVVFKRATSGLTLSVRECVDNAQWLKVKWRAGSDGQKRRI